MRLVFSGGRGSSRATLVDRHRFTAFSVQVDEDVDLGAYGVLPGDDDEVRVPAGWVERLGTGLGEGPGWVAQFRDMLRASERHGWYDAGTGLIRAHLHAPR